MARTYVAMARGDLARARRLATQSEALYTDAAAALPRRPRRAAPRAPRRRRATRSPPPSSAPAAIRSLLHGLGLAEAARRHDGARWRPSSARSTSSPNHIATIVDRAVAADRAAAASSSQARALPRGRGRQARRRGLARRSWGAPSSRSASWSCRAATSTAARAMLAPAAAKRPDGDVLSHEGLAQAYLQAFELDAAEIEAKRAIEAARRRSAGLPHAGAGGAPARARAGGARRHRGGGHRPRPRRCWCAAAAYLALGKNAHGAQRSRRGGARSAPDLVAARVVRARVDIADGHPAQAQRELERMERSPPRAGDGRRGGWPRRCSPCTSRIARATGSPRRWSATRSRSTRGSSWRGSTRRRPHRRGARRAASAPSRPTPSSRRRGASWRALARDRRPAGGARGVRRARRADAADAAALIGAARAHLLLGDNAGAEERARARGEVRRADEPRSPRSWSICARARSCSRSPGRRGGAARSRAADGAARRDGGALHRRHSTSSGRPLTPRAVADARCPSGCAVRPRCGWPRRAACVERGATSAPRRWRRRRCSAPSSPRVAVARSSPRPTPVARARAVRPGRVRAAPAPPRRGLRARSAHNARAVYHDGDPARGPPQARRGARKRMETAVKTDPRYADALYDLGPHARARWRTRIGGGVPELPEGRAQGPLRRRRAARVRRTRRARPKAKARGKAKPKAKLQRRRRSAVYHTPVLGFEVRRRGR